MRRPRAPGCRTGRLRPAHLSGRRGLARPNLQLRWRAGAGLKHRVHPSIPSPAAALASQMLRALRRTQRLALQPPGQRHASKAGWQTGTRTRSWGCTDSRRFGGGMGPGRPRRKLHSPRPGREWRAADKGMYIWKGSGPRLESGFLWRGSRLGRAFWRGFPVVPLVPGSAGREERGLHRGGGGGFARRLRGLHYGVGPVGRPAQEPAGNCSGLSRYAAVTKHLLEITVLRLQENPSNLRGGRGMGWARRKPHRHQDISPSSSLWEFLAPGLSLAVGTTAGRLPPKLSLGHRARPPRPWVSAHSPTRWPAQPL
ncbi:uncharacterized protein LOC104654246 [Rhinopithecus roxellana]|uniref:uncharacterized protein LOC104654246 n=1 Tax=Rhinopithecus roxellana TaxID=61622 RepID=UPI0012374146|nr:uncharacterized protein LOC104654246 [Rhinopithecus roxellana]